MEKARLKVGPKPLMQRLLDGIRKFALYFRKVSCAWLAAASCTVTAAARPWLHHQVVHFHEAGDGRGGSACWVCNSIFEGLRAAVYTTSDELSSQATAIPTLE